MPKVIVSRITRLDGTADALTTTFTYEPSFNQLQSVTDPLGHSTTFAYDAIGELTSITDPLNHQIPRDLQRPGADAHRRHSTRQHYAF